ncbi:MAG TPA: CPBP family glutamic-type intramembrane protease, partial [Actinomycetota bacterium]
GAIVLVGLAAQMTGWWLVASRHRDVWHVLPPILGVMGVVALLVATPFEPTVGRTAQLVAGLTAGLALYAGTRAFVWLAVRWGPFRRNVVEAYAEAATVPTARALVLSLALSVPGEELFWRGLAQGWLSDTALGAGGAAVAALALYVVANLPSRSLPIVAGAVVGGAVWGALAWWSGGVLAPLASHILWTGLMLVFPPGTGATDGTHREGEGP